MTVVDLHPRTLGGSQMANAIGVGWSSPIRTFAEITGKPGFERTENDAVCLGTKLQPVIFSELQDAGYNVHEFASHDDPKLPPTSYQDPERRWLVGHPDGFGLGEHDGLVVEAKAQAYSHADLSAEVQLLTYMHLGGYAGGLLATLANLHLEVRLIERDAQAQGRIDTILYLAERFWQYVEADEWPPATGHPDDRPALADAHEMTRGKTVRATKEVRDAVRELRMMRQADGKNGARKRRENYLGGIIAAHMGDAEKLIGLHDEPLASYPSVPRNTFDSAAFKRDHPDLYAAYTAVNRTRRLSLT